MKNINTNIFIVLFSILFTFNSVMITNVKADKIKDIPDSFTYYDDGAYWKISNIYDLKNVKLERLFTVGIRRACFPGEPCYPYCNCSNPDLGNDKKDNLITKFLDCVFNNIKRNIIGYLSFNAILKGSRAILIKYGKKALENHLAKIIPGVNYAYAVKLLYDSAYGCIL